MDMPTPREATIVHLNRAALPLMGLAFLVQTACQSSLGDFISGSGTGSNTTDFGEPTTIAGSSGATVDAMLTGNAGTGGAQTSDVSTASTGAVEPTTGCTDACTCVPQTDARCQDGDVYWFDSCDVLGELKEDCGASGASGSDYCQGSDIYHDHETVGCGAGACTSQITPMLVQSCGADACINGACVPCSDTYAVIGYECSSYSSAAGAGAGGGEIFEICGSTESDTGYMTIRARKYDGTTFGSRPYQVRVSLDNGDPCGPDSWFFVISDDNPSGIGTDELTFTFQSMWEVGQVEKAYCVTASTKPGDPGYDVGDDGQTSWWWSAKVPVIKSCN